MTRQDAASLMAILKAAYPGYYKGESRDEAMGAVSLWADMFQDFPAEIVTGAVKAFIASDTKGFPPAIGQIMEKVRKLTEPEPMTEMEAWALVKKALENSAYGAKEEFAKLPMEIQSVIHDPAQLREWATDDSFNENVVSSNFMRSYRVRAQSIAEYRAMPSDVKALVDGLAGKLAMPEFLEEQEPQAPG